VTTVVYVVHCWLKCNYAVHEYISFYYLEGLEFHIFKWYWIQIFSLVSDLTISGCSNCYQKWDWYVFIGWCLLLRALHVASHIVMSHTVREVNCVLHFAVLWYELSFWWWKQFAVYIFIRWDTEHKKETSWLWWFSYFYYQCRKCHTCAYFN